MRIRKADRLIPPADSSYVMIFPYKLKNMNSELLKNTKTRTFQKGDVILRQNEEADGMYIIDSGNVSIEIDNNYITTLEAGDFFGEIALMIHEPRTATVKVTSDELSVQFISKEEFGKIKEKLSQEDLTKILQRLNDNYERET